MGKGELTRQAILERATALASRVGLEGVTIGRLSEELGLSKSGLFAHFGAKVALEVEVLRFAAGPGRAAGRAARARRLRALAGLGPLPRGARRLPLRGRRHRAGRPSRPRA